ncbi:MAG TPA: nucleotidyl transferase AbiEii/AbiGii toxin family protein [Acidobacteriaceae bacterium]
MLYRVSQSKHKDTFILKGALLFELWTQQRYRPTRDADFLSRDENNPEHYQQIFEEICDLEVEDDGVRFDRSTVKVERIKEGQDYEGIRVTFVGYMEAARLPHPNRYRLRRCDHARSNQKPLPYVAQQPRSGASLLSPRDRDCREV